VKSIRKVLTVIVITVIFYFLISNLTRNWQKIPFHELRFDPLSLIISFVFLFINFLLFVEGWRRIIHRLGDKICFRNAFWIMSSTQIAKYVPGGIWFALGRVYMGRIENLKEEIVALSVVVETGLTFLVGILLFLVSIILTQKQMLTHYLFVVPIFLVFLVVIYPPVLNSIMNHALKFFKKPKMTLNVSFLQVLQLSIYFVGLWLAQIIGFYYLINTIYPISGSVLFSLASAYSLSWMTGFVVIFAPGGLGVREGMMTLLLSPILPTPLAIAITFIARVWITIFEIIIFFIGLLVKKRINP